MWRHKAPFNVTPTEEGKLEDWINNPEEVRSAASDDMPFHWHLTELQDFLNGLYPDRIPRRRNAGRLLKSLLQKRSVPLR